MGQVGFVLVLAFRVQKSASLTAGLRAARRTGHMRYTYVQAHCARLVHLPGLRREQHLMYGPFHLEMVERPAARGIHGRGAPAILAILADGGAAA